MDVTEDDGASFSCVSEERAYYSSLGFSISYCAISQGDGYIAFGGFDKIFITWGVVRSSAAVREPIFQTSGSKALVLREWVFVVKICFIWVV